MDSDKSTPFLSAVCLRELPLVDSFIEYKRWGSANKHRFKSNTRSQVSRAEAGEFHSLLDENYQRNTELLTILAF